MSDEVLLSIQYFTDPSMRERDPAKAINVLYDLIARQDKQIMDLKKRIEALEGK
jgi:hypothetical protein